MKRIILFDFDGTLADTFSATVDILRGLSTKYGYKKLTNEEIQTMKDLSIQEVFKVLKVPFYKLPLMVVDVKKALNKQIRYLKPIKGMDDLLRVLKKKGYILALITSNNKDNVKAFLHSNNLELFDYIYTGTTLFGKARVIEGFLHKYSLTKKQVVYIGDEIRDIEATKKVGMPIIAVTWGYNSRKGLERLKPEFLINKPNDALHLLELLQNYSSTL